MSIRDFYSKDTTYYDSFKPAQTFIKGVFVTKVFENTVIKLTEISNQ